jgi:predicted enzyme related to lactoylglutathione lyase
MSESQPERGHVVGIGGAFFKAAKNGVRIDPKREEYDYGRFAWIYDPDGNKIELWQP